MSRGLRIAIGAALALALVLATGALTRYQHRAASDRGELRLAWRLAVPRIEECRTLTPEEQAELPAHMRRDEVCEGRAVSYRLEVRVDDALRYQATVAPEGARGDRPLQVFREFPLEPGTRQVRVVFERVEVEEAHEPDEEDEEEEAEVEEAEMEEAEEPSLSGAPRRVVFDRRLEVRDREVVLITYDPDERELVRR